MSPGNRSSGAPKVMMIAAVSMTLLYQHISEVHPMPEIMRQYPDSPLYCILVILTGQHANLSEKNPAGCFHERSTNTTDRDSRIKAWDCSSLSRKSGLGRMLHT